MGHDAARRSSRVASRRPDTVIVLRTASSAAWPKGKDYEPMRNGVPVYVAKTQHGEPAAEAGMLPVTTMLRVGTDTVRVVPELLAALPTYAERKFRCSFAATTATPRLRWP